MQKVHTHAREMRNENSISAGNPEKTSRYSSVDISASCELDGPELNSRQGPAPRPVLRPTKPLLQWIPGAVCPGVKLQVFEIDCSLPFSAKVKNCGAVLPLLMA